MGLNTQFIEPATLTGYTRRGIDAAQAGSLARFLPNDSVLNTSVRFTVGENGLVPEAEVRDFDAEPTIAGGEKMQRKTVDLVAISRRVPVAESEKLLARMSGDTAIRNLILKTTNGVVKSISDRAERLRGQLIETGSVVIDQSNFGLTNNFGRDADLNASLSALVSATGSDVLGQLGDFVALMVDKTGERPGVALASQKVINAFTRHAQFAPKVESGATRPATLADVNAILADSGLPVLEAYDRRTFSGRVLTDDKLFLLPSAGDVNGESALGGSIWGITESSFKPEFGLADGEIPGAVAAVWDNDGTAGSTIVDIDSTFMPILKDANLSAALKVI